MSLFDNNLSEWREYRGSRFIQLYDKVNVDTPIASVVVPLGIKRAIIILKNNPEGLSHQKIDMIIVPLFNSTNQFSNGRKIFIYNLSDEIIASKLSGDTKGIKPRSVESWSIDKASSNLLVPIALISGNSTSGRIIYSRNKRLLRNRDLIIICYYEKTNKAQIDDMTVSPFNFAEIYVNTDL